MHPRSALLEAGRPGSTEPRSRCAKGLPACGVRGLVPRERGFHTPRADYGFRVQAGAVFPGLARPPDCRLLTIYNLQCVSRCATPPWGEVPSGQTTCSLGPQPPQILDDRARRFCQGLVRGFDGRRATCASRVHARLTFPGAATSPVDSPLGRPLRFRHTSGLSRPAMSGNRFDGPHQSPTTPARHGFRP